MYAGSALNKLLEADWRSGRYMENWLIDLRGSDAYAWAASQLPPMTLSTWMGWAPIAIEAGLAIGLAVPRLRRATVWLALVFHAASVLLSNNDFGVFLGALLAGYIAFADWPRGTVEVRFDPASSAHHRLRDLLDLLDIDRLFRWRPRQEGFMLELEWGRYRYRGFTAGNVLFLLTPFTYFALAVPVIWPYGSWAWIRGATLILGLAWFNPLTGAVLQRLRRGQGRREETGSRSPVERVAS